MTNREQAKMTMYSGLEAFVTKPANAAILDANDPFATETTKFIAVRLANTQAAAKPARITPALASRN